MFENIKNLFYKVVSSILPASNVAKSMNVTLPVNDLMTRKIEFWKQMYMDVPEWTRTDEWDNFRTAGLSSAIASEFARLTTLEFVSEIKGEDPRSVFLNEQYQELLKNVRVKTEYATALGGMMIKPFPDNGKIAIDFVQADKFFPVTFSSNGEITSCIFVEHLTKEDYTFTRTEFHELTDNGYVVTNRAFKRKADTVGNNLGDPVSLSSVDEWSHLASRAELPTVKRPLYAYFKMPFANIINMDSNLGVSVFARAERLIRQADEMWNAMQWEYDAKEVAIDVNEDMLKPILVEGRVVYQAIPKGKERMFRTFDADSKNNSTFYNVYSPEIRESSYITGYNKILQQIEFSCGLAYGTLSDPNVIAKTATEIKISKQRSYATVADIQTNLEEALRETIDIMETWTDIEKLAPARTDEDLSVSFTWDDSIITDTETESKIRMSEVAAGIIDPINYVKWRYKLDNDEDALLLMPRGSEMIAEQEIDETEE